MLVLIVFSKSFINFIHTTSYTCNRNCCCHTLIIIIYNRNEYRSLLKTAHLNHLRQMLVLKSKSVYSRRIAKFSLIFSLIISDHLLAAARITGKRKARKIIIIRKQTHLNKWRCYCYETCSVTARICNPL